MAAHGHAEVCYYTDISRLLVTGPTGMYMPSALEVAGQRAPIAIATTCSCLSLV